MRFDMNVISGRFSRYLSIISMVFESIIGAICCMSTSICSVYISTEMKATFAYEITANTNAESNEVSMPILKVSLLEMLSFVAANTFIAAFITQMHPANFVPQSTNVMRDMINEDISIFSRRMVRNMYAAEMKPSTSPAFPAMFHMVFLMSSMFILFSI